VDPTRREAAQEAERNALAPFAARSGESRGRVHPEPEHPVRTAFQRDRDRIVHCSAFRRLEYKTQVFLIHEGDHYRTRLTHTLEVAQISRTIARALRLNEDLAEAIALAHDIGHTPFGHAGEDVLRELMADAGGFEHNQHGLRVVDLLERRYPDFPGLNLTWELREGIAKHKTIWDRPPSAESEFGPDMPVLEAQIVEAADTIAYDNHDIDDGLRSGVLRESDLLDLPLFSEARDWVLERWPGLDRRLTRHQVVRRLIDRSVSDLIETTAATLREAGVASVGEVREAGRPLVGFSSALREQKRELQSALMERLYRHWRVLRVMNRSKRILRRVFRACVEDPREMPPRYRRWVDEVGVERAVCDYVAGMTDRYAEQQYVEMFQL
jgi:dGTPase